MNNWIVLNCKTTFFDAVSFFDVNRKKKLHIFREQSINIINISPF